MRHIIAQVVIVLLMAINSAPSAFAIDTTFGEVSEPDLSDKAHEWWLKDHEAREFLKNNNLAQAKASFETAVKIAEKNTNADPGLVNSLAGLALLEHKSGNKNESERLYELAMRYEEGCIGARTEKFALFLPDLAWLYQWHGKTAQAEILYKRALAIMSAKSDDDPKVSPFLLHYKAFLTQCGRTSDAEKIALHLRRIESKAKLVQSQ